MRVQVPLSAPLKNQCLTMSIKINRFELTLNAIGIGVSFICFFHCLLVITIFLGLIGSNIHIIEFFEDDLNHFILIAASFFIAFFSQIRTRTINNSKIPKIIISNKKILIIGGSLLSLSFFMSEIFSELLIILGAFTLLSMHINKLLNLYRK